MFQKQKPKKHVTSKRVRVPSDAARRLCWSFTAIVAVFSFVTPHPLMMALVFLGAYFIHVWADDEQKTVMSCCVLAYMGLNAFFITHNSGALATDPTLWIANRLVYGVGLALFGKHLVDKAVEKWNGVYKASALGFICIFLAYAVEVQHREHDTAKCKSIDAQALTCVVEHDTWYSTENLLDDVLMGAAFCFLVSATESSGTERDADNDEEPSDGDESKKQREPSNVA